LLKYVATEIVLFPLVAFNIDISQGGVAKRLRCGGIFSDGVIANVLMI